MQRNITPVLVCAQGAKLQNVTYNRLTYPERMKNRAKLLFLIPHLGGGGAEQVTALYLRNLCPQKYELHLGLITQRNANPGTIPVHVSVHGLDASRVRAAAIRLLYLVRRLQPDLILSSMAHLNFLVLLLRPLYPRKTRVVVRQNSTVSASLGFDRLSWYTGLLYKHLYLRADLIVCQTQAMARDLRRHIGIWPNLLPKQVAVAPNPIDLIGLRANLVALRERNTFSSSGAAPQFLAVGRLAREKGFDLLLRALSIVRVEFPNVTLAILGAGAEEDSLRRLTRVLNLDSAVHFAGHVENPAAYFSSATAYVLSSWHEGLPNALLEAAAAGLPLIVTPASSGVVELLAGHSGVWIADAITSEAIAASMRAALLVLRPGQRFPHAFVEQFGLDRSVAAFESMIDTLLENPARERI